MLEDFGAGDEVVVALDLVGDGPDPAEGPEPGRHLPDRPAGDVDPAGVDALPAQRLDEHAHGAADVEGARRLECLDTMEHPPKQSRAQPRVFPRVRHTRLVVQVP